MNNDFEFAYGTQDHEDELIAWERREQADEDAGIFYGDPRRCPVHGTVISSPDGMFDGLCGQCEAAADGAYDDTPLDMRSVLIALGDLVQVAMWRAALEATRNPSGIGYSDDDIPF